MELIGDEKRIRALFSELKFADEQAAPSFTSTWSRAQAGSMRPRSAFNLSFVGATTLLICALVSLALWSKYSQRESAPSALVVTAPSNSNAAPVQIDKGSTASKGSSEADKASARNRRWLAKSRQIKLAAQRQAFLLAANRKAAEDARAIESWQSPTAALLASSSDELFKSLPQLNENANELKSFLPNRSNEKEK